MINKVKEFFSNFKITTNGIIYLLIADIFLMIFTSIAKLHNMPIFFELLIIFSIHFASRFLQLAIQSFKK